MRAEEDYTENGDDKVEIVGKAEEIVTAVMLPKSQVRCNTVRLTGNMMRVTKPLASL